jgi:DNA polymerase III delta prime subunit
MKLDKLTYGQIELLRLKCNSMESGLLPQSIVPGIEAKIDYSERAAQAMIQIGFDEDVIGVKGFDKRNDVLLSDLCTQNLPRLAWVVSVDREVVTLQVHTFLNALHFPTIDLAVDEKILESLERVNRSIRTLGNAVFWLQDQFLVDGGGGIFHAFITPGTGENSNGFALHGQSMRAFIRRVKNEDQSEHLIVDKVVRSVKKNAEQLSMLTGVVRFVDATVAGKLRVDVVAGLSSLVASGSSFLALWEKYGELENDATLRRARDAGWLSYDHFEKMSDDRFLFALTKECSIESVKHFQDALEAEQGISIEAGERVPEVIQQLEMSWQTFHAIPPPKGASPSVNFKSNVKFDERNKTVILTQSRRSEASPPTAGNLFVSLQGDTTRIKRREDAREAIRSARCPMPQLGYLLEDLPVPSPRHTDIPELSLAIERKIFGKHPPTRTQRRALWVALNTPDIALIQGPPGTGKTTIIVALTERLQEIWETSEGIQGRLLLSGFQHDAVENAIQRMSVNGLPPIKFGGKSSLHDEIDGVDASISRWCSERLDALVKVLPEPTASEKLIKLVKLIQAYTIAPGTLEQTVALLRQAESVVQGEIPVELLARVRNVRDAIVDRVRASLSEGVETEELVRCVRALRVEARSFLDDGSRNAGRLALKMAHDSRCDATTRKLLDAAANWTGSSVPPFLEELRVLRRELLLGLLSTDRMEDTIPRTRIDVLNVLGEARDHLDQRRKATFDSAVDAAWRFHEALQSDPEAVKHAVISYTSVFAATCQQSARQELAELKGSEGYDTVVVDEAARANPLDLFIPLARAKRRIILVGDHRQLPHILDQKLEKELEDALATDSTVGQRTSEMLKESLFERLFNDLKRREEKDGVPRTVTLDAQYRMHPALGNFVSEQFYAPYGEAFGSPLPASDFAHTLPGYEGPAAWFDVPLSYGAEKSGQSKSRPVEALAIANELKRLMDSPEGRNLTFGIISFYSEQVKAISLALEGVGIVNRDEGGVPEIEHPYKDLQQENGRIVERLRNGTVDAFQGMEFDVVFLSMVRSNNLFDRTEAESRKKYGHLMSPNRLCVAMSRQKRLLIVAGDEAMLTKAVNAKEAIKPIVAFHKLSQVNHASRV